MIRSDSLDSLNAALSAAQGEFEAVDKTSANPFFKSKFAPLPEVVKAASPILAKHGLSVWQGPDTHEGLDGGQVLWTVVLHSSGQYIGSAMSMHPVKDDPQAQGSAITYARRYAYMAALGLVADEDDDAESTMRRSKPVSRQPSRSKGNTRTQPAQAASGPEDGSQSTSDAQLITDETLAELSKSYKAAGVSRDELLEMFTEAGASSKKPQELTEDQGTWVVLKLHALAKEKAA